MSDDRRNEGLLLGDIIGLESLVDEITHRVRTNQTRTAATPTAILGPFWRRNAPRHEMGDCIVQGNTDGEKTFMCGSVRDCLSGTPIDGAGLDVWLTAPNGLYEQQDQKQPDMNLRGTFQTGPDGRYYFYCIRPTSYPIPDDGPAGRLLHLMDRHPMRPAHIHFIVGFPHFSSLSCPLSSSLIFPAHSPNSLPGPDTLPQLP